MIQYLSWCVITFLFRIYFQTSYSYEMREKLAVVKKKMQACNHRTLKRICMKTANIIICVWGCRQCLFGQGWPRSKPIHDSDRLSPLEGARSPCGRCLCHSKDTQKLIFRNVLMLLARGSGSEGMICCVMGMV